MPIGIDNNKHIFFYFRSHKLEVPHNCCCSVKMSQLFLLATLLLVGVAQSQYIEWTVEDYPNPMVEPAKCGRPASLNMSKVCDPNGIISQKDGKGSFFNLNNSLG